MIVPNDVVPIDYLKDTNEFIFVTAEYVLRVNYENRVFELQTPDKLAFNEDFDFVKTPPEYFEVIDFGLVEWIRKALVWNKSKTPPKDSSKPFSFEVDGLIYEGMFNTKTSEISLRIPGKTLICKRDSIVTDFPMVQFIDHGQLVSKVTTSIISKMKHSEQIDSTVYPPSLPIVFRPESIIIDDNTYGFDYLVEVDMVLLEIPYREIQANILTIETDAPELAELHNGMLYDVIRAVVYENDTTE
jgi:hypothetical protein